MLRVKLETSDNYMAVWLWGHSPGLLTQDLLFLTPGCSASETDACLLAIASISTFKKGNGARIKWGLRSKMMHIAQQRRICLSCVRLLLSPAGQKPILPPPLTLIFIDQLIDWWLIEGWGQDCFWQSLMYHILALTHHIDEVGTESILQALPFQCRGLRYEHHTWLTSGLWTCTHIYIHRVPINTCNTLLMAH